MAIHGRVSSRAFYFAKTDQIKPLKSVAVAARAIPAYDAAPRNRNRSSRVRTAEYVTARTLDSACRRWLAELRESTAARPALQLDPARAALLVIDMVRYFAEPGGRCFLPAAAVIAPRVAALVEAWHEQGGTVVFTRHGHEGPHDLGMLGRFFDDYIRAGEPESELIDTLEPGPGDTVLRKTTYDAFLGTPLAELLEERGHDQVLITGVLTHMCCETTARSAFCRGYEVYLAADGSASSSERRHLASLEALADAVAVVLSTEEILERCAASR
jgi:nicotinamidase-related amidase